MSVKKSDYLYIERWCDLMGSKPYFVTDELRLARESQAPATAIYQDRHGRWHLIEDVTDPQTHHYFTSRGWMTRDWKVPEGDRR